MTEQKSTEQRKTDSKISAAEASFVATWKIKGLMLDSGDSKSCALAEYRKGSIAVISEKGAVAYVHDALKFSEMCPRAHVVGLRIYGVGAVHVSAKTCSSQSVIAAVVLRAGYDIPLEIGDKESGTMARALAESWGSSVIVGEIDAAVAKL